MPWDKFKSDDGEWCVHKVDPSGEKTGDALGCHKSEKDASAQVQTLYSNVEQGVMLGFFLNEAQTEVIRALYPDAQENLHLTLLYVNESSAVANVVPEMRMASRWISEDFDPLSGTLNGVARFNGEEQDAFVMTFDSTDIGSLRSTAEMYFSWMGIPVVESHGFTAHITLGYLAKDVDLPDLKFENTDLRFETLSLAFGAEHFDYSFIKQRVIRTMAPKFTVTEQRDPLNASRVKVQFVTETVMSGGFPDIPLPDDILRSEMGANQVFVTLPVGKYNSRSLNDRNYSADSMNELSAQINSRRPESNWGHITDYEFGYRYNPPPVRWLASVIDSEGVVWAKGRALTPEAQDYYRNAKIDNARVGTSIFAWAEMDGEDVKHLDLITIDLADPARVGVPLTSAKPLVTTEMNTRSDVEPNGEIIMNPVTETPAVDAALQARLTELSNFRAGIISSLKVAEGADPIKELASLMTQRDGLLTQVSELEQSNKALTAESAALLTDHIQVAAQVVKLDATREEVIYLVEQAKPANREEVKTAMARVLELPFIKSRLEAELAAATGGNQTRPNEGAVEDEEWITIPTAAK